MPSATIATPLALLWTAWIAVLSVAATCLLARFPVRRTNFLGASLPTGYGWLAVLGAGPMLVYNAAARSASAREWAAMLVLLVGLGAVGFFDDGWGQRQAKGIRGHLRVLIIDHTITSGLVKAVAGLVLAAAASWMSGIHGPAVVLAGLIVALSANAVNLLDLRPGRAGAAFLFCSAMTVALAASRSPLTDQPLLYVALSALPLYWLDRSGRALMGDTGANSLGACLGLGMYLAAPSLGARIAILVVLAAMHAGAEKWSISALIERHAWLRALDRTTGLR